LPTGWTQDRQRPMLLESTWRPSRTPATWCRVAPLTSSMSAAGSETTRHPHRAGARAGGRETPIAVTRLAVNAASSAFGPRRARPRDPVSPAGWLAAAHCRRRHRFATRNPCAHVFAQPFRPSTRPDAPRGEPDLAETPPGCAGSARALEAGKRVAIITGRSPGTVLGDLNAAEPTFTNTSSAPAESSRPRCRCAGGRAAFAEAIGVEPLRDAPRRAEAHTIHSRLQLE